VANVYENGKEPSSSIKVGVLSLSKRELCYMELRVVYAVVLFMI
jgi:hypothetical protein